MKSIKLLFISVSLLGLLSACYDDKGNYDYNDFTKIEIGIRNGISVTLGETVKITPELTFSKEDPNMKLSYAWILEGELVSTDPVFVWVADHYTKTDDNNLILEITDSRTELVYRQSYSVKVRQLYDALGYFVLTRKNGKVCVNMIKEGRDENDELVYIPHLDIYSTENNGEELSSTTFKLYEHYSVEIGTNTRKVKNQLMFIAPDQTVEVIPATFKKEDMTLSRMFGGALPAGMAVSDVYFMQFLDLIKDKEGRLYSRVKSSNEFFHIDQFLPTPMTFGGEELRDIEFIPSSLTTQHCLMYDKVKKRLLMIWDYTDYYGEVFVVGKIEAITSAMANNGNKWPEGVPTIEEAFKKYELRHLGSYKTGFGAYGEALKTNYFAVLKDPESGALYHYKFCLEQQYGAAVMKLASNEKGFVDVEFKEFTGKSAGLFGNSQNKIYTLPTYYLGFGFNGYLTLVAQGKDLYVYNRVVEITDEDKNQNPRLLCSFDADIALMAGINSSHYWGKYLGVALKNGGFEVLSMENANYSNWNGRVWKSQGIDLGEPIDLIYSVKDPSLDDWR